MNRILFLTLMTVGVTTMTFAGRKANVPQTFVQPDGSVIHCYTSGDEYHHWIHDGKNFTIVQHPISGYFVIFCIAPMEAHYEKSYSIVAL